MKFWSKIFIGLVLISLVVGSFGGCQFLPQKEVQPPAEEVVKELLIPVRAKQNITLSVLNDVEEILRKESVYREKLQNQAETAQLVLELFFIHLNVPLEKIPEWAKQEKDLAVKEALEKNKPVDYAFLDRIFERLVNSSDGPTEQIRGSLRSVAESIFDLLNIPLEKVPSWFKEKDNLGLGQDFSYLNSPEEKFRLLESAVQGFINSIGDPFASYADPIEVALGITESSGEYEGIGVQMEIEEGKFVITVVFEGTPAEEAGIEVGDIILEIDGKDLSGCTNQDISLYIRSKKDPQITLKIKRGEEIFDITLEKRPVKQVELASWPSFDLLGGRGSTAKDLPYNFPLSDREGNLVENVVYIKIPDFSIQAVKDLYYVLQRIPWEDYEGIIIDVRENPGGYVHSTIAALSYFFKGGEKIIITEDYAGRTDFEIVPRGKMNLGSGDWAVTAHPGLVPSDIPVVVLIGSKSFSGAEVFAGAMRHSRGAVMVGKEQGGGGGDMIMEDVQRATLIGKERTGGKGTVNRWVPLREGEYGALYIAIALWKTAAGEFVEPLRQTEEGGLLPQVLVEWTERDRFLKGQDVNYDQEIFAALDVLFKK